MNSRVKSQSLLHCKPFPALIALVRHLPRVPPHVDRQGPDLHELLGADPALVGLVSSVLPGVLLHVVLPGEGLSTVAAGELLLLLLLLLWHLLILNQTNT